MERTISLHLGDPHHLDFWAGDLRSRAIDLIASHVDIHKGFSLAINLADRLCVRLSRAPSLSEVMACAGIARSIVDPKCCMGGVGIKCDGIAAVVAASVMSALEYNLYVHTAYVLLQLKLKQVDARQLIMATKTATSGKAADIVEEYMTAMLITSAESSSTADDDQCPNVGHTAMSPRRDDPLDCFSSCGMKMRCTMA